MVCAGILRLSLLDSMDHSALSWARALTLGAMGVLGYCFCGSTYLAGEATQSRLAIAGLAAGHGNRCPVTLRDLFRGWKILAQTLWFRRLFHTGVGTLAGDN